MPAFIRIISLFSIDILDRIAFFLVERSDIVALALCSRDIYAIIYPRHVTYRSISGAADDDLLWTHLLSRRGLLGRTETLHIDVPVVPSISDDFDATPEPRLIKLLSNINKGNLVASPMDMTISKMCNLQTISVSQGVQLSTRHPILPHSDALGRSVSITHFRMGIRDYGSGSLLGLKQLCNLTSIELYLRPPAIGTETSRLFSANLCHFIGLNTQLENLVVRECGGAINIASLMHSKSITRLRTLKIDGRIDTRLDLTEANAAQTVLGNAADQILLRDQQIMDAMLQFVSQTPTERDSPEDLNETVSFLSRNPSLQTIHWATPIDFQRGCPGSTFDFPRLDNLEAISGFQTTVRRIMDALLTITVSGDVNTASEQTRSRTLALHTILNLPLSPSFFERVAQLEGFDIDSPHLLEKTANVSVRGKWKETSGSRKPFQVLGAIERPVFPAVRCLRVASMESILDIYNTGEFFAGLEELHIAFKPPKVKVDCHPQDMFYYENGIKRFVMRRPPRPTASDPDSATTIFNEWKEQMRKYEELRHSWMLDSNGNMPIQMANRERRLQSKLKRHVVKVRESDGNKVPFQPDIWIDALSQLHNLKAFHGLSLFKEPPSQPAICAECAHWLGRLSAETSNTDSNATSEPHFDESFINDRIDRIANLLPALQTMDHWIDPALVVKIVRDDDGAFLRWEVEEAPKRWDGLKLPPYSQVCAV